MPALIVSQRIWSGSGFSTNSRTLPSASVSTRPYADGIVDRRQDDRGLGALRSRCSARTAGRSTDVKTSPLKTTIGSSRAVAGRELDRAAGAERLRLDDVAEVDAEIGPVAEHLFDAPRLVVQAEHDLVDFRHLPQQVDLVLQERPVEDRDDRLRRVERQRPEPRAFATGEQDGSHDNRQILTRSMQCPFGLRLLP